MGNMFYKLGKMAGPKWRKTKWIYKSATGSQQEIIEVENTIGKDFAAQFKKQVEIDPDPQASELLNKIGEDLTSCLKNKNRHFHFDSVVEQKPNAFALPGGYIFVSRALLELCKWDPDEIAAIIAHEIAHVVRKHAMDRLIASSAISLGLNSVRISGALSKWIKQFGVQSLNAAYSQDQEAEADDFAVRLTHAAGYDPHACLRLFTALQNLSQQENTIAGQYFSTHPLFNERIKNIRKSIARLER